MLLVYGSTCPFVTDDELMCLKIASCLGSVTKYSIFDVLSEEIGGVNLRATLRQLMAKGFLIEVGERVRFSHDKVSSNQFMHGATETDCIQT